MMSFFTDPYEDELLYSVIARYHFYMANSDCHKTLIDIFKVNSVVPSLELNFRLDNLSTQLNDKYPSEYFIKKHTLIPYYGPFLPKQRLEEIIETMKHQKGSNTYTKLGFVAGSVCKKDFLYYCPQCCYDDKKKVGEPYFHRVHQLQGVMVCHKHGCILKPYKFGKTNSKRVEFIRLNIKHVDFNVAYIPSKELNRKLIEISSAAKYVLQNDLSQYDQEKICNKYKILLMKKEYSSYNGRVDQYRFCNEFRGFYGGELLKMLESDFDIMDEHSWLRMTVRKPKKTIHPIRNILVILFLVDNIAEFFQEKLEYKKVFGSGPWPCLNPVSGHYRKKVIRKVDITYDGKSKKTVGTFKCKCGFIYSRSFDENGDIYKFGRIKEYGEVWINRLAELSLNSNLSLREMARIMRCDTKTIIKYKYKVMDFGNKVRSENQINKKVKAREHFDSYKSIYERDILEFIKLNPECTRKQIRLNLKKQYAWFYRNDKKWIESNFPPKMKIINSVNNRVSWKERDLHVKDIIEQVYNQITLGNKLVRITVSMLGRRAGILSLLEKYIKKLPVTKAYLDSKVETIEDFQIRRLEIAWKTLYEEKERVRRWELVRKSGLKSNISERVKITIDKLMNMSS